MAGKNKNMHQVKQIIELHFKGKGIRETERMTGITSKTIRNYLQRIKALDVPPDILLLMNEDQLGELLYREESPVMQVDKRFNIIEPQLAYYAAELHRRGVTRQ